MHHAPWPRRYRPTAWGCRMPPGCLLRGCAHAVWFRSACSSHGAWQRPHDSACAAWTDITPASRSPHEVRPPQHME
eukprot:355872-Chlamydomonas_euryale.AAC.6